MTTPSHYKLNNRIPVLPFKLKYFPYQQPVLQLLRAAHSRNNILELKRKGDHYLFRHRDTEYLVHHEEVENGENDGFYTVFDIIDTEDDVEIELSETAIAGLRKYIGYHTAFNLKPFDLYLMHVVSISDGLENGITLDDLLNMFGAEAPYEITSSIKALLGRSLLKFKNWNKPPARLPYRVPIFMNYSNSKVLPLKEYINEEIVKGFQFLDNQGEQLTKAAEDWLPDNIMHNIETVQKNNVRNKALPS